MDFASLASIIADILRGFAFVMIYFVTGFGPGYVIGLLLANRLYAKDKPLRIEKHDDSIKKAAEHNSQWHPENSKWK